MSVLNVTTKGAADQYGAAAQVSGGKTAFDSTQVVPAATPDPKTGANRSNIVIAGQPGTYKAGSPTGTQVLVSAVIQNKTDAMVVGQNADNFLASTVTAGAGTGYGTVAVNAAQDPANAKSLSPSHE